MTLVVINIVVELVINAAAIIMFIAVSNQVIVIISVGCIIGEGLFFKISVLSGEFTVMKC